MSKGVDVYSPTYVPKIAMTVGEFSHVTRIDRRALVTRKEESFVIVGPGGSPRIELPASLAVYSNYPPLASLTFQYSDGLTFRIDIDHSEVENFRTSQLPPKAQQEYQPVPPMRIGPSESVEEPIELFPAEYFGGE